MPKVPPFYLDWLITNVIYDGRLNQLPALLGIFNPERYAAPATVELVPAWLRFLESRRLITRELRIKKLHTLRALYNDLLKVVKNTLPDPVLRRALKDSWENAEAGPVDFPTATK